MRPLLLIVFTALALGPSACQRSPEARLARFMESGKRYVEKKDYARAIIQFSNATRVAPNNAEPLYQLGLAHLENRDLRRAMAFLKRATELNPKHSAAQLKLAQLMLLSGQKQWAEEAEKRAETVLESAQLDPEALDTAAFAELQQGKGEDAQRHLERALEKFPSHLKSAVLMATVKLSRRDLPGAEAVLQQAVAQAPKSPEPLYALARLYIVLNRLPDAETQYRRTLEVDPRHAPALRDLAALRLRQGKTAEADGLYRRLAALPLKEYKPAHALFLATQGRLEEAIPEFEALAKADPNDRPARSRLIAAYLRAGKPERAAGVLIAALKTNPKDIDALLQYGSLLLLQGKVADAQAKFTQVLSFQANLPQAHYGLARAFGAAGDRRRQRDELNETLRLDPALLAARLDLARSFLATGSAKTALDALDQAPAQQKNALELRIQRNWALFALDQKAELRQELARLLPASRAPELLLQQAQLELQDKNYAAARPLLEEMLQRAPEDLRALDALVHSYAAQNQLPAALARVREHVARRPNSAALQTYLGRLLITAGKPAEARALLAAARAYPPAQLALAQLDISERKLDTARRTLSQLLAKGESVPVRMLLGNLEELAGQTPAALPHYRKVVELDPSNAAALNNLAYLLADSAGQFDEALKFARQALELVPDNPSLQDTLGWIYYRKGLYATALPYLEKAATPTDATPRRKYHLAMTYLRMGQVARGRQFYETALKMDASLPEAQAAQQLLIEFGQAR